MTKTNKPAITIEQLEHFAQQKLRAEAGEMSYFDIIMPNGKKLGDCTGEYLQEVSEAFRKAAEESAERLAAIQYELRRREAN
jgi:hypothetical protein